MPEEKKDDPVAHRRRAIEYMINRYRADMRQELDENPGQAHLIRMKWERELAYLYGERDKLPKEGT